MRKKKKYLVGYDDDYQCVYGKAGSKKLKDVSFTDPMTISDARKKLKHLEGGDAVIYKLVRLSKRECAEL